MVATVPYSCEPLVPSRSSSHTQCQPSWRLTLTLDEYGWLSEIHADAESYDPVVCSNGRLDSYELAGFLRPIMKVQILISILSQVEPGQPTPWELWITWASRGHHLRR